MTPLPSILLGCALCLVAPTVAQAQGILTGLGRLSLDGASLDDPQVPMARRVAQARALGRWGEPDAAVKVLLSTLARRPAEPLRTAVVQALAARRSVLAVPELLRALRGRVGPMPWIGQALLSIGGTSVVEPMVELAQHREPALRGVALSVLARLAPERVAGALADSHRGRDALSRLALRVAIEHPHVLWLSALRDAATDVSEPATAQDAAWALSRVADPSGLTALVQVAEALPEPPIPLRVSLAVAVAGFGREAPTEVRDRAVLLIERGLDASALRVLRAVMQHRLPPPLASLPAWASVADRHRASRLRHLLHDPRASTPEQRVAAIRALVDPPDAKTHVPLSAALSDPDAWVRRAAVVALHQLRREAATDALRHHATQELDPGVTQLVDLVLQDDPLGVADPWSAGLQALAELVDRPLSPLAP